MLAPLIKGRKGFHTEVAKWAEKKGYPLLRVDGKWIEPVKFKALDRYVEHTISVELGRFNKKQPAADRRRLIDAALALGRGTLYVLDGRGRETVYSTQLFCPGSGRSFDELEPRLFSFNSVHGWCPSCQGFGTLLEVSTEGETEAEREVEIERARASGSMTFCRFAPSVTVKGSIRWPARFVCRWAKVRGNREALPSARSALFPSLKRSVFSVR